MGVVLAPFLFAGYIFGMYFAKGEKEKLPYACLCCIVSQVFLAIYGLLSFLVWDMKFGDLLINSFVVPGIYVVLYFYFMGVCKRFAETSE